MQVQTMSSPLEGMGPQPTYSGLPWPGCVHSPALLGRALTTAPHVYAGWSHSRAGPRDLPLTAHHAMAESQGSLSRGQDGSSLTGALKIL